MSARRVVADDDLDAQRQRARLDHGNRLRMALFGHEERLSFARRAAHGVGSAIASAAAVPSSSSEALAMSIPVRSQTIVWKLMSASSRPWAISA